MNAATFDVRILQLALVALFGLTWAAGMAGRARSSSLTRNLLSGVVGAYALLQIGIVIYLWANHVSFPLNLEAMELTVLAHVRRVLAGLPIYVPPSPGFAPLAYNPLYYFLAVPFTWVFGPSLTALRAAAIAGMLGCMVVIFLAVRRETGSAWWGVIAAGLFAAAYRAMDTYLDNAHADSWILFCVLLGVYLISLQRSRAFDLLGTGLCVASFWFKQPGAAFAVGVLAYLTIRQGMRKAWPYWLLAGMLGLALYMFAPARWTGPLLHEYTWTIPRQWVSVNFATIRRLVGFHARAYGLLAVAAGIGWLAGLRRTTLGNIWYFLLPFAALTALSGAMDSESNNNVFIPLGTWLIVTGVLTLDRATKGSSWLSRWRVPSLVAAGSFVLLVYNPWTVIVSPRAAAAYADLQGYLKSLDGTVYAPWIGPLPDGYRFSPEIHWVPMTDIVRQPGKDLSADPVIQSLLEPVVHPPGRAYILTNIPLEQDSGLSFLTGEYELAVDLGARFQALSTLPKRYNLGWPRYLYVSRGA